MVSDVNSLSSPVYLGKWVEFMTATESKSINNRHTYAFVKPALLQWAREAAGLSVEDAAKKIGVKPDRLIEWETAATNPTVPQLRKISNAYKRSIAVFFLPEPPVQPQTLQDFRRVSNYESKPYTSQLILEIRRARRRRSLALRLFEELNITIPKFNLKASVDENPDIVAKRGRDWLNINMAEQAKWQDRYASLRGWTDKLEAKSILVFHTKDVKPEEMLGFALSEETLPVIVLNGKDEPRRRVFTLLHEFVHLMLGLSGVSDLIETVPKLQTESERIEVFCNRVAGAILVPDNEILSDSRVAPVEKPSEWTDEIIKSLADRFAVSREVILRRLLILGKTTQTFYEQKRSEYNEENAKKSKAVKENKKPVIVPQSRLAIRNNGVRYTELVLDAYERNFLNEVDFSDHLGVKTKHLDKIAEIIQNKRKHVDVSEEEDDE